jgi:hypothetical protein
MAMRTAAARDARVKLDVKAPPPLDLQISILAFSHSDGSVDGRIGLS